MMSEKFTKNIFGLKFKESISLFWLIEHDKVNTFLKYIKLQIKIHENKKLI